MLIATAGVAGARIHLELGGLAGTVTFQEAASEIGIEVSRYLPPGANPETEPATPCRPHQHRDRPHRMADRRCAAQRNRSSKGKCA